MVDIRLTNNIINPHNSLCLKQSCLSFHLLDTVNEDDVRAYLNLRHEWFVIRSSSVKADLAHPTTKGLKWIFIRSYRLCGVTLMASFNRRSNIVKNLLVVIPVKLHHLYTSMTLISRSLRSHRETWACEVPNSSAIFCWVIPALSRSSMRSSSNMPYSSLKRAGVLGWVVVREGNRAMSPCRARFNHQNVLKLKVV